jgi:hypothetical protein
MKNRFNLNESDKTRIRAMHGIQTLNEVTQQPVGTLPEEIEACINSNVSLIKDRELMRTLPRECWRLIGYEASKSIAGKKVAEAIYPNHAQNQKICIANGIDAMTADDETFEMVMTKIDEIIDCLAEKGVDLDLETLSKM